MKKSIVHSAVKKLKKVANKKNSVVILDNILNDNGKMTVSTLDVEYTINVGFAGKFLIELKQFDKILSKLPANADIDMEQNGLKINLTTDKGAKFGFPAQDFEDFPMFDKCPEKIGSLNSGTVQVIKNAAKFVSDDVLRPVMECVYVSDKIVATDAHKLVYFGYQKDITCDILIRVGAIDAMNEDNYNVSVLMPEDHTPFGVKIVKLEHENETITFREVEGKFPNWQSIIPEKSLCNYSVNAKDLVDAVNLALLSANDCSKLVAFDFNDLKLIVSSADLDYDRSFTQDLECTTSAITGIIQIGMKGTFLLDLLKGCGDTVQFRMTDASRCVLIDSDKLLMPMMLR